MISLRLCKNRLALLWFSIGGFLILFGVFFSIFGGQGALTVGKFWNWLLPNFVPTLSLMIGVLVADERKDIFKDDITVTTFMYRLTVAISCFYFILIVITFFFSQGATVSQLIFLDEYSSFWLAPVQGLVSGVLGLFFLSHS